MSIVALVEGKRSPRSAQERGYVEFLKKNPGFDELFDEKTFEVINAGRKTYSAHAIVMAIRWDKTIKCEDERPFKIKNEHFPYLARHFMEKYPDHAGFFVTRRVNGDPK